MSLAPIVLFYMLSKMQKPAGNGKRAKDWPGPDSPPPHRAHRSKHHGQSKPAEPEHAPEHKPEHAAEPSHAFAIGEKCLLLPPDGKGRGVKVVVRGYKGAKYMVASVRGDKKATVSERRLRKANGQAPAEHHTAPVHTTEAEHHDSPAHTDKPWSAPFGPDASAHQTKPEHLHKHHHEPKHASADVEEHQAVDPVSAAQWIYKNATSNPRWNWGTKNARNAELAQAQSDMGLSPADADGVYGPATRVRGKQLLGKPFPIRGAHAAVSGRPLYIP